MRRTPAAQTPLDRQSERERVDCDQPDPPGCIEEQHQDLTQNLHQLRGIRGRQLVGHAHRQPIAPQQFTCRSPGAYLRQQLVFFTRQHDCLLLPSCMNYFLPALANALGLRF